MAKQTPPFGLRMPKELSEWVRETARSEGRSMNNWIVRLIEKTREADQNAET